MIRVVRRCALLAALASAGVAWGQTAPAPGGPAPQATRIVTLHQKGGLPEPCRVLKTWTTANGEQAYLLQTLGSEEKVTVVQKPGAKPGATEVGAKIYRWCNSKLPPGGSPMPPPDTADGIRPVSHTTTLPDLPAAPVKATARPSAPAPAAAPVAGAKSASREMETTRRDAAPRPEKAAAQKVQATDAPPVPVSERWPGYGYYPTQWRQWPGGAETPASSTADK